MFAGDDPMICNERRDTFFVLSINFSGGFGSSQGAFKDIQGLLL